MREANPPTPRATEPIKRQSSNLERFSDPPKGSVRGGFTIVELLIVVVIIAILAAITIVAYNGIIRQATHAVAASDMKVLYQSFERFKIENGSYPKMSISSTPPQTELEEVVRKAGLYEQTRYGQERIYIFCSDVAVTRIAVVAAHISEVNPFMPLENVAHSSFIYFDESGIRQGTIPVHIAEQMYPRGRSVCLSIDETMSTYVWSFNVPTKHAP